MLRYREVPSGCAVILRAWAHSRLLSRIIGNAFWTILRFARVNLKFGTDVLLRDVPRQLVRRRKVHGRLLFVNEHD
jgi:hypothetical protein